MTPAERTREWRRTYPERARVSKQKWRLDNPEKVKEERNIILAAQGNCCAVCETTEPRGKGDWHTDHCHTTGRVRGILCASCNLMIGRIEANPARVQKMLGYLEG